MPSSKDRDYRLMVESVNFFYEIFPFILAYSCNFAEKHIISAKTSYFFAHFVFWTFEFVSDFDIRHSDLRIVRFEQFAQGVAKNVFKKRMFLLIFTNFLLIFTHFYSFLLIFAHFFHPTCAFDAKTCAFDAKIILPFLPIPPNPRLSIGNWLLMIFLAPRRLSGVKCAGGQKQK